MKKIYFLIVGIILFFCACSQKQATEQSSFATFDNSAFSLKYPKGYHLENVDYDGVNMLYITKSEEVIYNSLQIIWTNGPAFEYPPKDLALALVYNHFLEYDSLGLFYEIMPIDSTYTIDNNKTYSVVSVFEHEEDTIIQSKCLLSVANKTDIIITELLKNNGDISDAEVLGEILQSIKFK